MSASLFAVLAPAPAQAQSDDQAIEALVAESSSPAAALAAARAQTENGDLPGAAATLERVLLDDPNAHDARVMYAATLCRLGDLQAARIEIGKLDRHDIGGPAWADAEQACGGAFRHPLPPESATREGLSGEVYAGFAYEGDAAGATALQTDFGFGSIKREDGLAVIAGTALNWRSAGYAAGGGVYGGLGAISKHDIAGPDQDYDIGQVRFGYGRMGDGNGFAIAALLGHTRLSGDPYVTEYGGQAELIFGSADSRRIRVRAEGVGQDYRKGFPGNSGDGMRFDLLGALESRLGARSYLTVGLAGELKTAAEKSLAYRGGRLFGAVQIGLAHRQYIDLSSTLRYIDFRDDSPRADRKDFRAFGRAAYGIPLNSSGLFVEGAVSYALRKVSLSSTTGGSVPDFKTYHSPGAELRFLWKF
jgi:hypothetical protein